MDYFLISKTMSKIKSFLAAFFAAVMSAGSMIVVDGKESKDSSSSASDGSVEATNNALLFGCSFEYGRKFSSDKDISFAIMTSIDYIFSTTNKFKIKGDILGNETHYFNVHNKHTVGWGIPLELGIKQKYFIAFIPRYILSICEPDVMGPHEQEVAILSDGFFKAKCGIGGSLSLRIRYQFADYAGIMVRYD